MAHHDERLGCLFAVFRLLGLGTSGGSAEETPVIAGPLPYRLRDDFLSPAERSFYGVLKLAVGDRVTICPKVRLGDLLFTLAKGRDFFRYNNAINSKHIDFLLCEPETMRPVAGVELDDSSHARADRVQRDRFVEEALRAASLPLLRFAARRQYAAQDLLAAVEPLLQGHVPPAETAVHDAGVPMCPKCGVPMVLRIAHRGNGQSSFYGCPNFPRCREIQKAVAIPPRL